MLLLTNELISTTCSSAFTWKILLDFACLNTPLFHLHRQFHLVLDSQWGATFFNTLKFFYFLPFLLFVLLTQISVSLLLQNNLSFLYWMNFRFSFFFSFGTLHMMFLGVFFFIGIWNLVVCFFVELSRALISNYIWIRTCMEDSL